MNGILCVFKRVECEHYSGRKKEEEKNYQANKQTLDEIYIKNGKHVSRIMSLFLFVRYEYILVVASIHQKSENQTINRLQMYKFRLSSLK